jgi:hypothetical protein
MKARNWKIEAVDFYNRTGYFDINLGRFGYMELQFDVEFTRDGNEVEEAQVYLTRYDLYDADYNYVKHGILNNRNSKLICESLQELIYDNPTAFGFEYEDEAEELLYWQELRRDERY